MDYMTKPLSRTAIRNLSKHIRRIFDLNSDEPFPVLHILEKVCFVCDGTEYEILEDHELPANVFAWCYPKPDGGLKIEIKQTVYDGAYNDSNGAFLCFICHEICHVILFYLGYTPISSRTLKKDEQIPAFRSVEWQAKALCGELTIPFEATVGMSAKEIVDKYHVSMLSAKYRAKQRKSSDEKGKVIPMF